jgi:GT2 family glycosyltransferase/glycosyltransferase involved in cell wall biosynthesis
MDVRPRRWRPFEKPELDQSVLRASVRAAWDRGEALAEAGDHKGALAWLDRAHRMAPADQNLCLALAVQALAAGAADQAVTLFGELAARHGTGECWAGLAAAQLVAGRPQAAEAALSAGLSANAANESMQAVAAAVLRGGWCGIRADGTLLLRGPGAMRCTLDGVVLAEATGNADLPLPAGWMRAQRLEVTRGGHPVPGSPIDLPRVFRMESFVERTNDGVAGWAWYPGAPTLDPELRLVAAGRAAREEVLTAAELLGEVDGTTPSARPRRFAWAVPATAWVQVLAADGRDVLGSPLPARGARRPPGRPAAQPSPEPDLPVDVVIPVYRGLRTTLDCIGAVLGAAPADTRVWVVDDASPEPALVAALAELARSGAIRLIGVPGAIPGRNRGYPAAVNAGMRAASGRHVVLLNSDTLVPPGFIESLRDAACSAPDIGTATPLSNEASIFSVPKAGGGNPAPDLAGTRLMSAHAARANAGRLVQVPTAHGFCMFIRRDCLAATGLFDEASFAQGYGEENDFCERARSGGFRHVAVPGLYVAHLGGISFGPARTHLLNRNQGILEHLHPGYAARVAGWIAQDRLFPARRRIDMERWKHAAAPAQSCLLVTHNYGGGTGRVVEERALALREQGTRPIVLRAVEGRCEVGEPGLDTPNLAFELPFEAAALKRFLATCRPIAAEIHHLLGHDHSVMDLITDLDIPYDVWIHDYAWFCAQISFVTGEGRFCGEPDAAACDNCVARWGRWITDPVPPAALRRRSAAELAAARSVIVPSRDVARRVARYAPRVCPHVQPWETDPPYQPPRVRSGPSTGGPVKVVVVGAVGVDKGFDVLRACAQDAAARGLNLSFVVVGYSVDDAALLATGRVFITGRFAAPEAAALIAAQSAQFAFLPSIWPETWCYALSDVWTADLSAVVFDIGTPAERVRACGRGWLLPLGLPPAAVNDALLSLARG